MRGDQFFARLATKPPFSRLHPKIAAFFKEYLGGEKVIRFGELSVVNTQFPPFPSLAFDRLTENFGRIGEAGADRLYSVTLAVTNRCRFQCWHCYNAGRSQEDLPLSTLQETAAIQGEFKQKRDFLVEGLKDVGVRFDLEPQGTFYAWGDLSGLPPSLRNSDDFFKAALDRKVICVPGHFFDVNPGKRRTGRPSRFVQHVRFSFGPHMAVLEEALGRLDAMVREAR